MNEFHSLHLAEPKSEGSQYPLQIGTINNTLGEALSTEFRQHHVEPKAGLGTLDRLPLEIVLDIILQLELRSALTLGYVNRKFASILDSLLAPNIIRSILAIDFEEWISTETLYKALATDICKSCGQPGHYMYILTCHRVCFSCFTEKEEYIPLSFSNAERKFDIPPEIIESLPCIQSLPGVYTPDHKVRQHRTMLVDFETARQAGIRVHGSEEKMQEKVASNVAYGLRLYTQLIAF